MYVIKVLTICSQYFFDRPAEIEKFCPWISSQSIHVVRGKDDVHFARQINRWRNEKYKHSEDEGKLQPKKCPVQIVIVTYSLLQTRYQIANTLRDCEFECIIADESHNLKQSSSQRCQLALPLLQSSKRLVLLSGTPALNRPVELWPQLHALDPRGKMFGDIGKRMTYTEYTKRFCNAKRTRFGWDVKGVSNADELHKCLKTVMMRRLKCDVLQDLPSKQRSIVPVTISDKDKERESRETISQLGNARQAVSEITDLDADDVANSAQWEARKLLMQGMCLCFLAVMIYSLFLFYHYVNGEHSHSSNIDAYQQLQLIKHPESPKHLQQQITSSTGSMGLTPHKSL